MISIIHWIIHCQSEEPQFSHQKQCPVNQLFITIVDAQGHGREDGQNQADQTSQENKTVPHSLCLSLSHAASPGQFCPHVWLTGLTGLLNRSY